MTADDVVHAGAALLDQDQPGWESRIDKTKINMWDNCIIHQVYGVDRFTETLQRFNIYGKSGLYGFTPSFGDNPIDSKTLCAAWIRYLENKP